MRQATPRADGRTLSWRPWRSADRVGWGRWSAGTGLAPRCGLQADPGEPGRETNGGWLAKVSAFPVVLAPGRSGREGIPMPGAIASEGDAQQRDHRDSLSGSNFHPLWPRECPPCAKGHVNILALAIDRNDSLDGNTMSTGSSLMTAQGHWIFPSIHFSLPQWVGGALPAPHHRYKTDEEKMMLVIELSRLNIEHGSGGPFGAAIFDISSQRLLAPGVNLVPTICWSCAHAEIVAIAMAQKLLGKFDLGTRINDQYELFSSAEPCAMCLGAITWSGVRRLVHAARDEDVRAIGFDEGVKAREWRDEFQLRGIDIVQDLCRDQASAVLRKYECEGGLIYNGRTSMRSRHQKPCSHSPRQDRQDA